MHRAGKLGEAEVYRFATEGRLAEVAVALTLICGVENDIVERALLAPGSDILVILAKLAGFSWATAKAILLLKAGRSRPFGERSRTRDGKLRTSAIGHRA